MGYVMVGAALVVTTGAVLIEQSPAAIIGVATGIAISLAHIALSELRLMYRDRRN